MIARDASVTLDTLLEKVYEASSHDFRQYRRNSVIRRLDRRLQQTRSGSYLEYAHILDTDHREYRRLTDYLTIYVSSFFRNTATFQQVAGRVLPELIAAKTKRGQCSLSFWSAACASGEEPYSIAITLLEYLGQRLSEYDVSIHATDINQSALRKAQLATYKNRQGLPDDLLERYFPRCGEGYRLKDSVRRMVEFGCFDLLSAETASPINADCIFCCNALIYMQRQLQEKVLNMIYNSLAVPGYLVLGEVETLADSLRDKMETLDAKAKIYKRRQ